ncbi:unnamed protein product, partial [Brassica rapa subsp. narinosa]
VPLPCLGRFLLASSPATAFQVCFRGVSSRRITVETGSPALGCSVSVLFALDPGSSRSLSLVLSDWPCRVFILSIGIPNSLWGWAWYPGSRGVFFHGFARTARVLADVWCFE